MKKVCVIGAGPSGLTTIKQLLDEGHVPTCYEEESDLGGVFHYGREKNGVYDSTYLTISNYLMVFSDFPPNEERRFWHHAEYKEYLGNYTRYFGLDELIEFGKIVTQVKRADEAYLVTIHDTKSDEIHTNRFDAIAVCTGGNQIEYIPEISGLDSFTGEILHAGRYKNNRAFAGKKVVCVGIGESSVDITTEVCQVAQTCTLAMRSYPTLVPRIINNTSSDATTTRMLHAQIEPNERAFYHLMGGICFGIDYLKHTVSRLFNHQYSARAEEDAFQQSTATKMLDLDTTYTEESLKLIKAWSVLSGGRRFLTKNVTFIPYVLNGQIQVVISEIKSIDKNCITFQDGRTVHADTLIFGTGFRNNFRFLGELQPKDGNVRNLFMNAIHPDFPDCAYIGWARPTTGGNPACAEMSARYFALLLSGKVTLREDIHKRIEDDKAYYAEALANSSELDSLVLWKRYMDTLATLIGCQVTFAKYLMNPRLFYKLFYGSFIPAQYRLEGPHADYQMAKRTIMQLPVSAPYSQGLYSTKNTLLSALNVRQNDPAKQFYNDEYFPELQLTTEEIDNYRFIGMDVNGLADDQTENSLPNPNDWCATEQSTSNTDKITA